jgi:hypothetical protein
VLLVTGCRVISRYSLGECSTLVTFATIVSSNQEWMMCSAYSNLGTDTEILEVPVVPVVQTFLNSFSNAGSVDENVERNVDDICHHFFSPQSG